MEALRESVLVREGRTPLWRWHLERLRDAGLPPEAFAEIGRARRTALAEAGPGFSGKLQLVVAPDGSTAAALDTEPSSLAVPGGPTVLPVKVTQPPELPPGAAKPASRAYWDGPLRLARSRGADLAVLVLPGGEVIDAATATVFAVIGDGLVTPPAPPAIAGVARRVVLGMLAPGLGLRTCVRTLEWSEFECADEAFLANAVGGVVPVRDRGGAVTARVSEAFEALLSR